MGEKFQDRPGEYHPYVRKSFASMIAKSLVLTDEVTPTECYSAIESDSGQFIWAAHYPVSEADVERAKEAFKVEEPPHLFLTVYGDETKGHWIVTGREGSVSQAYRFESAEDAYRVLEEDVTVYFARGAES